MDNTVTVPTILDDADDFTVFATNPADMVGAQKSMILWCARKIQATKVDMAEAQTNLDAAKANNFVVFPNTHERLAQHAGGAEDENAHCRKDNAVSEDSFDRLQWPFLEGGSLAGAEGMPAERRHIQVVSQSVERGP